jgi:hypothetical protein
MNTNISGIPEALVFMDYRHSALRAPAGNDGLVLIQSKINPL